MTNMKTTMTTRRAVPLSRNATVLSLRRWADATRPRVLRWWGPQSAATKLAFIVATLFVLVSMVNLTTTSLARLAAHPAVAQSATTGAAPALTLEAAPPSDPTKSWNVTKVWQGTASRETEAFTVSGHWRVDWLFSPQPGGSLEIFVYSADGRLLLNLAANTQKAGADTSFWAGPGTYFLKVNSSGGDWKVDVQDLR